jgi:hypothetical protein
MRQAVGLETRARTVSQRVLSSVLESGEKVNEIVVFSVGSRSAVSIPCEENFILARNLPLDGTKPGSSLLSMEGVLGRSPSGEAFWPSYRHYGNAS